MTKVKRTQGAPKKATALDIQTRLDKYELETNKFDAKVINHISDLRDVIFNMALDEKASPTNRKSSAMYLIEYAEKKYDADEIERRSKKGDSGNDNGGFVSDNNVKDVDSTNVVSLIDLEPYDAAEG